MRRFQFAYVVVSLFQVMQLSRVALGYPNLLQRVAIRSSRRTPFALSSTQLRYLASNRNDQKNPWNTQGRKETRLDSTLEKIREDVPSTRTTISDSSENQTLTEDTATNNSTNVTTTSSGWSRSLIRSLRKGAGAVASSVGFVSSAATSYVTDRAQYRKIQPSVDAFTKFLNTSGIELELTPSLNYHLLRNIVVLSRIQRILNERNDRREQARSATKKNLDIPSREEALRYMRYSTAAYGSNMILAAEMDAKGKFDTRWSPVTRTRISEHIGVPEEDIVLMDVDYGNDINHLRHFVAVDHQNKKIVLSIRGTFTLSEIVVDVAAFSRPCYGGEAHSEMYTMAERVWVAAGGTVVNMLKENEGYEFIVCGHSLGAGTACLVNIMCQSDRRRLIGGRKARCFAYASPPVFSSLELIPDAVQSTTNYIHEKDVVPFLSVDSVRHVFSSVRVIEDYMQNKMTRTERVQLAMAYTQPDEGLIEAVRAASVTRLEPKHGAPILSIPAAANVWMKECGDYYDFDVCDPLSLSKLVLNVDIRMAEDHLPPRYEHALENLMDEI